MSVPADSRLVFRLRGVHEGVVRSFVVGDDLVLGSAPELDPCLAVRSVSRRHARLRAAADAIEVEDLGSKNGTFVNGRRVHEPQELSAGDVLRAGSVDVRVGRIAALGSTETGVHFPED